MMIRFCPGFLYLITITVGVLLQSVLDKNSHAFRHCFTYGWNLYSGFLCFAGDHLEQAEGTLEVPQIPL